MEQNQPLQIFVALKTVKSIAKPVKKQPITLPHKPKTLRELIEMTVRCCIFAYEARAASGHLNSPLNDEQYEQMQEIGKFAFDVHYNQATIDEEASIRVAIEAVEDGLVRIFCGERELSALDEEIKICEGDVLTFVRLTMLSGRMW